MSTKEVVESAIKSNQVVVFSQPWCGYCRRTKQLLSKKFPEVQVAYYELDERDDGMDIKQYLLEKTGQRTVPNIFINQQHIGGNQELQEAYREGNLQEMLALNAAVE